MMYGKLAIIVVLVFTVVLQTTSLLAADDSLSHQSVIFRAGGYFPATKSFDVGTGFDFAYALQPVPYTSIEASIGYYRAEFSNTAFLSAIPLTVSAKVVLPLEYISIHTGGGIGSYYKMAGGTTELPSDHSEFSFGYHANAGLEVPTSSGFSLLLDCKYLVVDQGNFKSYGIKHGGTLLYGGFALSF